MNVSEAIAAGDIGGRLWFYTNYHCNLACTYCLTESRPGALRRLLDPSTIVACADEAVALGFTQFGVTGGEPFLLPDMPALLADLARRLPVVVLTNGTLFGAAAVDKLRPLADLPLAIQISLDSADEAYNDRLRGPGTFAKVIAGIRALKAAGFRVRIGTTVDEADPAPPEPLRALLRDLDIPVDDHVVRPIARLGRAKDNGLGIPVELSDIVAELTLTSEGAFWSPAAPSVTGDRIDIDYLLTRTLLPLTIPANAMVRLATGAAPRKAFRVTCA